MNKKIGFRIPNILKDFTLQHQQEKIIKKQAREEKNIIFGGRSIQAQIGMIGARATSDWDIFSNKPKKSAIKSEKSFDNLWGSNHFYIKEAQHKGTFKVMSKGNDGKKGTYDDFGIIDYSKMPSKKPKVILFMGNKYRKLSQEKSSKYKALRDKTQKFRWEKDREDVNRIKIITGKKR